MTAGNESETPAQAEAVFYAAFENGDRDAMAGIWSRSEDVVCVHPHGPQLVGYEQVVKSWADILGNTAGFRIAVQLVNHYDDGETSIRFVTETLINENSEAAPVTVLATNAYRRTEAGWRIVLHHASPAPRPEEDAASEEVSAPDSSVTLH